MVEYSVCDIHNDSSLRPAPLYGHQYAAAPHGYAHPNPPKESNVHRNPYESHDAYDAIRTQDADLAVGYIPVLFFLFFCSVINTVSVIEHMCCYTSIVKVILLGVSAL